MTSASRRKLSLTAWIMIALFAGIAVGLILYYLPTDSRGSESHWVNYYFLNGLFNTGAAVFLRTLKMLVVPLVFISLVCGTSSLGDPKSLGRIGGKVLGLYLVTTALAITIALTVASFFSVGIGTSIAAASEFTGGGKTSISQVFIDIFPENPIKAMADGTMLQVIFFAVLFGLSVTLAGEKARGIADFFNAANEVVMKMIGVLMYFAPIGVFCVVAKVFGEKGIDPIFGLLKYFWVMIAILSIHAVGVYGGLLKLLAGLNPYRFFANMRPALATAFGTASSNATLPITLNTVEKHLGVDNKVASFSIPLGATINMDGTAIMQGVATVFIANAAGIDLQFTDYLMVILTATFASVGTAGVPGVGMITLAMVLQQVGLPEKGILLLLPVDRLLDMYRTAVNICGDAAVSCIVAKSENQFDRETFDKPIGQGT